MSDKTLFKADKFTICDFKIMSGQVDAPEDFFIEKVTGHNLDNSLELGFNFEEKLVKADFTVDIETDSKGANKVEAKASFHFVFIYKADNLEEMATIDKKKQITLDPFFANAIASITYATSRGVLLTRLQGTALQNFVLPVIDPVKLLGKHKK